MSALSLHRDSTLPVERESASSTPNCQTRTVHQASSEYVSLLMEHQKWNGFPFGLDDSCFKMSDRQ